MAAHKKCPLTTMDYSAVDDGILSCSCGRKWKLVESQTSGVDDELPQKKWTWVPTPPIASSDDEKERVRQFWIKKNTAKKVAARTRPAARDAQRQKITGV